MSIIAWVPEDELPRSLPSEAYSALYPHSRVDGIRLFPVFGPAEQTLRDYFAAKALPVVARGHHERGDDFLRSEHFLSAAADAYALADAMIAARTGDTK